MNPNLAQTLDPKLKETYDRIMGTQVPTNVGASSPEPQQQTHVPVERVVEPNPAPVVQVNSASPQVSVTQSPEMVSINTVPSVSKTEQVSKGRKISPVSPIIFVAVGVLFFLLYAFIWLKVFKIF